MPVGVSMEYVISEHKANGPKADAQLCARVPTGLDGSINHVNIVPLWNYRSEAFVRGGE